MSQMTPNRFFMDIQNMQGLTENFEKIAKLFSCFWVPDIRGFWCQNVPTGARGHFQPLAPKNSECRKSKKNETKNRIT